MGACTTEGARTAFRASNHGFQIDLRAAAANMGRKGCRKLPGDLLPPLIESDLRCDADEVGMCSFFGKSAEPDACDDSGQRGG